MRKRPTKIQTYDLIIALFAGLTFAVLSAWYISPALMASPTLSPYIAPNFGDYCEYLGLWDVQHIRQIKPDEIGSGVQAIDFMHPGRRTLTGSIPARLFLSKFGVIDSLTAGALLCSVIFGGSLYLWATALFGRLAGIFSVIAALSTGSLCLMTRHLTFYPTITAFFALAGAATTIAMRNQYRSGWPYLLAGIAIGGSLLVDVRGLIWVGMCIPFLGVSILWQRKFFPILRNVLLLGLPIWVSFQLGSWNTGRLLPMSLEEQVDIRSLAYTHGARGGIYEPPYQYPYGYSWGNSPIKTLPKTIDFLGAQLRLDLPESVVKVRKVETNIYNNRVRVWEEISIFALLISLIAIRRDKWALSALIITGLPYAAAQLGIHTQHEFRVRFLFNTLPFTSILIGISCSFLAYRLRQFAAAFGAWNPTLPDRFPAKNLGSFSVAGLAIATALLAVSGIIDSPIHPTASWRGGKWIVANGHVSNLQNLVKDIGQEARLDNDPWSNPYGLSKRWTFRSQTCIPQLLKKSHDPEQIFASSFYKPLRSNRIQQAASRGVAPSMGTQNQPTQSLPPLEEVQGLPPMDSQHGLPPLDGSPTQPAQYNPQEK